MDRSVSAATVHASAPSLANESSHIQFTNSIPTAVQPASSWTAQAASLTSMAIAASPKSPALSGMFAKGSQTDEVKAIPRDFTCFVGRLDRDATTDDLCEYLSDVSINEARCRKLDDKDGLFRTAAFHVGKHIVIYFLP